MKKGFKFGVLENGSVELPHSYHDEWAEEQTTGPNRLVIGPSSNHVGLLRELSGIMRQPFGLLYVLVVPRKDGEPARYQCPRPLSRQEVLAFLDRFGNFLEADGRHHLWVKSVNEPDLLVYDRHNLIYAYGSLADFAKIITARSMTKTLKVSIPDPHVHYYREEYDSDCLALLEYWDWRLSPLRPRDSE